MARGACEVWEDGSFSLGSCSGPFELNESDFVFSPSESVPTDWRSEISSMSGLLSFPVLKGAVKNHLSPNFFLLLPLLLWLLLSKAPV